MSVGAHLSEGVLRQLMQQVGLSESGSADPAQLLRRIEQLGRSDETGTAGSDGSGGYDTVCDDDEESSVDESSAEAGTDESFCDALERPVSLVYTGRNNNGTQRLRLRRRQRQARESDDEKLDQYDDPSKLQDKDTREHEASTTAVADGVESLQLRMDGVVLSVIEGLRGAVQSLLKLHTSRSNYGQDTAADRLESIASLDRPTTQSVTSLNESSNCRGADGDKRNKSGTCCRKARPSPAPSPERKPPPAPCDSPGHFGRRAERLLMSEGTPDDTMAVRWHQRQQKLQTSPELPTADYLARRLENLELLLLSFMHQKRLQRSGVDSAKLSALMDLKRSLGCLQAKLLQLQARELSRGVHRQHERLDRTWNIRRDWRQVPRVSKSAPDAMLACALGDPAYAKAGRRDRPACGDRWLLKFLPRAQRRALPHLMRTAGTYGLVRSSPAAFAAASAFTRARGRPLVACRHLRDPRDDVIQKFVYALQQ